MIYMYDIYHFLYLHLYIFAPYLFNWHFVTCIKRKNIQYYILIRRKPDLVNKLYFNGNQQLHLKL